MERQIFVKNMNAYLNGSLQPFDVSSKLLYFIDCNYTMLCPSIFYIVYPSREPILDDTGSKVGHTLDSKGTVTHNTLQTI